MPISEFLCKIISYPKLSSYKYSLSVMRTDDLHLENHIYIYISYNRLFCGLKFFRLQSFNYCELNFCVLTRKSDACTLI